jgi:hypothetical protein
VKEFAMQDLKELSAAIVAANPATKDIPAAWVYTLQMEDREWQSVPVSVRPAVESLVDKIRGLIPDDFGFSAKFDEEGFSLALEYDDGMAGAMLGGESFENRAALFQRLGEVNWEGLRSDALRMTGFFDEPLRDAAKVPVNIRSSEEAARKYAKRLKPILKKAQLRNPMPIFVTICLDGFNKMDVQAHASKEAMLFFFVNALTCQYQVLAVLENGSPIFYAQIESYKLQAIDRLNPGSISRAMAEGRFPF